MANPGQVLAAISACGVMCPSGEFYCCSQQVLGPGGQWDPGQSGDTQQQGPMVSVVSAVTHPAHPWGGPAPAPTGDSQAVAAWAVPQAGRGCQALPAAGMSLWDQEQQ